jgi:hypothetical protein
MNYSETPFFYTSSLLFSEKDMEKLSNSVVAVAGVGGIGAIATEMMARSGIGSLKLADPDAYHANNLNRQLFATHDNLGMNKCVAASERLKAINPDIHLELFEDGIHVDNISAFCKNADVIICQPDKPSSAIILYRTAKAMGIPVVSGSRPSLFAHRWSVCADICNFKTYPDLPCFGDDYPEIANVALSDLTVEMLDRFDKWNHEKMLSMFDENLASHPELFGSISESDLLDRVKTCDRYHNRHVCAVIANTSGCLAASATLRILLGGPEGKLEINLWEGQ